MRIVLFLIANLAVMLLLGIIVKLFGVESYLGNLCKSPRSDR